MPRPVAMYYLVAFGCGVGLALYLLLYLRSLRLASGARRKFLLRLWPVHIGLLFPFLLIFRVVGMKLGLGDNYAAQICMPVLLGLPPIGAVIWYFRKYPAPQRMKPKSEDKYCR